MVVAAGREAYSPDWCWWGCGCGCGCIAVGLGGLDAMEGAIAAHDDIYVLQWR